MSNLPEYADRGRLRVSDADRERTAEILRAAAGDGRLTLDELDQRLDLAYAAKTYADLDPVTSDLPTSGVPAAAGPGRFPADRIGGTPGARVAVAIMSGVQRRGPWVVPGNYTCVAIMGGIDLDLREARFSQQTVTIQVFALMGGISIVVPEDIEVDVSGFGFMGGFDHRASGPGVPGAPCVRVVGVALMGGVDVRRKPPRKRRDKPVEGYQRPEIET